MTLTFDIVTPSFNQSRFLHETINSVLSQDGKNFKVLYYVMDGGSSDGSADLIRSYESKLAYWRSAVDNGQSAAIHEALTMGSGDIVAWINSDDIYPPGTFQKVAEYFYSHPEIDAIYGDCLMIDEESVPVGVGTHISVSWEDLFETPYLINQEATFMRRRIYEKVGGVDPEFWGAMDYDLWLRVFYEGRTVYLPDILGAHRFVLKQKSTMSNRYIAEMQEARKKFSLRYSKQLPPWPFSKNSIERISKKWEHKWRFILRWISNGCSEEEFHSEIEYLWNLYSHNGILSVMGGTSFGWIGPEALYILDQLEIGSEIDWLFTNKLQDIGARSLSVNVNGNQFDIDLGYDTLKTFKLNENKRFSIIKITADRSFIPAFKNMGPAYFNLSHSSFPNPKNTFFSVQSIPSFPDTQLVKEHVFDSYKEHIEMKSRITTRISPSKQIKVAFFTSHPEKVGSGSERLIYNTARALNARGHKARVYVMQANLDKSPPYFVHNQPVFQLERYFERAQARLTGLNDVMFFSTFLMRFQSWMRSADIWHFNNLHGHYISIPLLGLVSWTKPIVISPVDQYLSTGHCPYTIDCERYLIGCGSCPRLDDPWPGIHRDSTHVLWQMKRLFCHFSNVKLLFHTHYLAEHYSKSFTRHRPRKVIHYGEDINCFRPLPYEYCAMKLGLEQEKRFTIGLFHSHILEPRKGILPIIGKIGELAKHYPNRIGLLIVGHGSEAVKDMVPPDVSVNILPYLKHAHELANALNFCNVLLYPTIAENMSLTCLDALACGVPVISYDAGGQKEAIKDGINGYIVPVNDYEEMFNALIKMLENPELCERFAKNARNTAETEFDFERYIDELIEYYSEIL